MKNTLVLVALFIYSDISFSSTRPVIRCDDSRQDLLELSLQRAESMIEDVIEKLDPPDFETTKKLIKWFNLESYDDVDGISDIYERSLLWIDSVSFLCILTSEDSDTGPIYAYVYSDEYFVIHAGSEFFNAEDDGYNSKAGILIHELSHFILVGNTNGGSYNQEVYGVEEAIQLAKDDPDFARNNADNYEYFAESLFWQLE